MAPRRPMTAESLATTGTSGTESAAGSTASHTYGSSGTFTVTLKVSDDVGQTASKSEQVTVAAVPTAPASATATPSNRAIAVSWSPPSDSGDGAVTEYRLSLSPTGASVTLPASARAHRLTDLENGTAYTVTVQAVTAYGVGTGATATARPRLQATDFDGDGRAELAVWRPSTGYWYVKGQPTVLYGQNGDKPVVADFTGDGLADRAGRPSNGTLYVRGQAAVVYGQNGDVPLH